VSMVGFDEASEEQACFEAQVPRSVGCEVSQRVILLTCVSRCSVEWWTWSGLAALLWETS
jgi:hypothetical protein